VITVTFSLRYNVKGIPATRAAVSNGKTPADKRIALRRESGCKRDDRKQVEAHNRKRFDLLEMSTIMMKFTLSKL